MLSPQEIDRYSRQIQLPEIGISGQEKLHKAKVLVIGAGGLSCPALQYLAAAGVGQITILDDDRIQLSNLQRQILYTSADIGKSKALVAAERLRAMNPEIAIKGIEQRFSVALAEMVKGHDLVIDGSDNFATRYLVNDVCVAFEKPFVGGSILGFEGQTALYNYEGSASYRCLFPDYPSTEEMPNCDTIGVLGVVTGVIGTLMANTALQVILGNGASMTGTLLSWSAASMQVQSFRFQPSKDRVALDYRTTDYEALCGQKPVQEISWEAYEQSLQAGEDWICIDVREPEEFTAGNKGGINIPLNTLEKELQQLELGTKKILFCCRSGARSKKAVETLQGKAISNSIYSLKSGLIL